MGAGAGGTGAGLALFVVDMLRSLIILSGECALKPNSAGKLQEL